MDRLHARVMDKQHARVMDKQHARVMELTGAGPGAIGICFAAGPGVPAPVGAGNSWDSPGFPASVPAHRMVSVRTPDKSTTGIRCRLSQEPSEKGAYWPLIDKAPETPNPRSRVRCYGLSTRQPLAPEAVTANHVESYPVAARVVFSSQPESSACATAVECMMTAIAAAPALRHLLCY